MSEREKNITTHVELENTEMIKYAVIYIGPPTAGKSAHTTFLQETTHSHIVRGRDIVPGLVSEYESRRELIGDSIFIPAMERTLATTTAGSVVFDNIPRTPKQAKVLGRWISSNGVDLHVVNLTLTEEQVLKRAEERCVCPCCGETYNQEVKPAISSGYCNLDGQKLVKRSGDKNPEILREAFERHAVLQQSLIPELSNIGTIHSIDADGTVDDVSRKIFISLSDTIFSETRMVDDYFRLRGALEKKKISHLFISGMPVFMYGGRALMKDFDILIPDGAMSELGAAMGIQVGEVQSKVANTRFLDVGPGVEVISNLVVTADRQRIPFDFNNLYNSRQLRRFMGMECQIMGLEDLILFKVALGRFGSDDWGKHKDDLSDIEGLLGVQQVDGIKLVGRASSLGLQERLKDKLKIVGYNITDCEILPF